MDELEPISCRLIVTLQQYSVQIGNPYCKSRCRGLRRKLDSICNLTGFRSISVMMICVGQWPGSFLTSFSFRLVSLHLSSPQSLLLAATPIFDISLKSHHCDPIEQKPRQVQPIQDTASPWNLEGVPNSESCSSMGMGQQQDFWVQGMRYLDT